MQHFFSDMISEVFFLLVSHFFSVTVKDRLNAGGMKAGSAAEQVRKIRGRGVII